jgi:drug/metabolite transporter (DMT)-like permease
MLATRARTRNRPNAAAFQALAPAALVALLALVLLRRPPEPRFAAGLLAGSGLVLLALFAGVVGSAVGEHGNDAPSGGWVGLAGGAAIFLAGALALRGIGSRSRT